MKLLIDADCMAYRAGFAAEKNKYLVCSAVDSGSENMQYFDDAKSANERKGAGVTIWSRKDVQPVEQALLIADVMVKDIKDRYGSENPSVVTYLSGIGNFRHSIATRATYKGNRSGSVPPSHLKAIRNHLIDRGAVVSVGEEADDLLGIAATANPGSVVCSIDKDLLQLPGRHYNFVTKEEVTISPKEAALNFYSQVLSGDPTDNVPGVTGIGPVKARKALEGCTNPQACWMRCIELYEKEFGTDGWKYAVEAARLVFVRRKVGEVWEPPTTTTPLSQVSTIRIASNDAPQATQELPKKKASGKGRVPVSV